MTQEQLPHRNVAPPTEPFTSLDDIVRGTAEDVVLRSRGKHQRKVMALIVAGVILVVATATVTMLVVRRSADGTRPASKSSMTPALAVSYVQDEYPGQFPNDDKLLTLFNATCTVLDAGGSKADAVLPMIEGGSSTEQASYILNIAIYSTCPKYAER